MNVVKGAFGYTLGAIWDEPIPDGATTNKEGEITFPVEPKSSLEPFSSVNLSVTTNNHRIAEINGETPRMALAEAYSETCYKIDLIAKGLFDNFALGGYVSCVTNKLQYGFTSEIIVSGKLYREYLKSHSDDPDFILLRDIWDSPFNYIIHPVAGSRYNETPINRSEKGKPDYLQQIWQPFELSASYYPYAGEAVIRFSVRDIEDRTEHTNLVTVAELKKGLSSGSAGGSPATSKSIEDDGSPSNSTTTINGQREAGEPPALRQQRARTNNAPVVCGVRLGEANNDLISKYGQNGQLETYEIFKAGEKTTYSCRRCDVWQHSDRSETLFDTEFGMGLHVSMTSHKAYAVRLSHYYDFFEAREDDFLSYRPFKLSEQIAEVLKSKYGEPKICHSGDSKYGERKWYFENDGLYVTLRMNYGSNNPTTEQAQKGMRTYHHVRTSIQYIHLPTLEAAIQEGREFSARPQEADGEGAKRAAERL